MFKRNFLILASVTILTFAAAEARRGFSSGGSGSGAYNNAAPTAWNVDSTLDADCQNLYGKACSELTKGQYEEVQSKNKTATDNNYGSDSDYQTANGKGYTLSTDDGTQWTDAKSPGADNSDSDSAWNSDCDSSFSSTGGCDALSKANFASIDDASTGRLAATTAGYSSYKDWQGASALSYGMTGADATLWGEANDGSVSSAACDAEFAGKACNQLAKASFQNAKSSNALMTAKIAKVTAGTLTGQDLTDLSISFSGSALSSPVSAWQLDYLETVLGTSGSTTKANWQATIDGYNAATASAWYIWKIAASSDSSGTYAASKANYALFNAANVDSGLSGVNGVCATGGSVSSGKACATLGVTNTQIAANIRAAGFTAAPSATAMRDFLTEARGFADGSTYSDVASAKGNGWSISNYITALTTTGWTNTGAQNTAYVNCKSSTATSTGGSGTCSVTSSSWTAISSAIAAAADTSTDVTAANITAILSATSTTADSYLDTSNGIHMDYVNQCIAGATNPADTLSTCVASSDLRKNVKAYQVGVIADQNSGSYTKSDISTSLLSDIGVASNSTSVIGSSHCGTSGTSSCLTALRDAIVASNLDETATPATVISKINELMRAQMLIVANNTSLPAVSTTLKSGCSTSYNLPLPDPCGHSQWSCTKVQGPSSWTISGTNVVVPSNNTATGNQNVKIRMSLNVYSPAYTKDVIRTYNVAQAVAASANGYKKFSTSGNNPWGPWNACKGKGGDLATYANVNGTYTLDSHMWFAPSTENDPNNLCCSGDNYRAWAGSSEITCRKSGTNGQSKRGGYGNQWWHCNPSQSSYVKTYWCKNLPSC